MPPSHPHQRPLAESLTLSCPDLVPTPDEEALGAPDAQRGACQEGVVGRGQGLLVFAE